MTLNSRYLGELSNLLQEYTVYLLENPDSTETPKDISKKLASLNIPPENLRPLQRGVHPVWRDGEGRSYCFDSDKRKIKRKPSQLEDDHCEYAPANQTRKPARPRRTPEQEEQFLALSG